jgi:hypothetical protein
VITWFPKFAFSELNLCRYAAVQLPTGESNTLGIDRALLNGLAHNKVRSVNLTCAEPPLGDNSITVLAYAVMKSTSVVTLNIGVGRGREGEEGGRSLVRHCVKT